MLVGARGTTPNIAHHNVWFSADYEREFTQIANGELPSDPTIYACVSSITDPSQAPAISTPTTRPRRETMRFTSQLVRI